jgi:hypothetical protein
MCIQTPHLVLLQIDERSSVITVIRRAGSKGKSLWLVQFGRSGAVLRVLLRHDCDFIYTVHLSRLGNEWWLTSGSSTLFVLGLVLRFACKCGRFQERR